MQFTATIDTDAGIVKEINQDSALIKHASYAGGTVLMAIICDGMGGLSKGELASAVVVRRFSRWFDEELPLELRNPDMDVIGGKWALMLKDLNAQILDYVSAYQTSRMGTTFSGILFINDQYVLVHVGDSRIYQIGNGMRQLTEDHTFVAREVARGTMSPIQAKTDKRRNLLLQCIGASERVTPQVVVGRTESGVYMLCSDGFRHEITEQEMFESLNPRALIDRTVMHSHARDLIDLVKRRQERDNITVVLVKTDGGV